MMLEDMGLTHKRNEEAQKLSGAHKIVLSMFIFSAAFSSSAGEELKYCFSSIV